MHRWQIFIFYEVSDMIKEEMKTYWAKRVEGFSALRQREFASEKREQWSVELERYLPVKEQLNILDIGTGTGFFAFLLGEKGHHVTGIDITPAMIAEAKRLSEATGIAADFYVMDAEDPDFECGSFDVIVTRKLTWTLPDLPKAYCAWHRLLKPGGLLLNFDADYCRKKTMLHCLLIMRINLLIKHCLMSTKE